jgi:hypothetical protein
MKPLLVVLGILSVLPAFSQPLPQTEAQRQAQVARRSTDVMPFDLVATTHVFTKLEDGGTQRVIAKNSGDASQIKLVRQHLRDIQGQFQKNDFSGPGHIHGDAMPGLAELRAAKSGQISIAYRDVKGGAELQFHTKDAKLVAALHKWFDAQLADHGVDAMRGHHHSD